MAELIDELIDVLWLVAVAKTVGGPLYIVDNSEWRHPRLRAGSGRWVAPLPSAALEGRDG